VLLPVPWFWKLTAVPAVETLGNTKLMMANFKEPSGQRFFTSHCVSMGTPPTTAWAKFGMSPSLKNRPTEMKRLVCPDPVRSETVIPFPVPPPPPEEVTVRLTVVVGAKPPPVAFTVIEYVPVGVLAPTVTVIAELPEPGAGIVLGLKLTVVPEGAPDAVKLTALLNPPPIAVVIVDVACVPCTIVNEAGDADTVRLG